MTGLLTLLKIFIIVVCVPILGAVMSGIDRILTARMQRRMGPPVLQPFFDVFKLLSKEPIVVTPSQAVYVYLHLVLTILGTVFLFTGQDMLMALFILAFGGIALILGALCVRSPYSRIGGQREIMQMLAYEPIFVVLAIGIYLTTGSFMAGSVYSLSRPLLFKLPLIFVAFVLALSIKMRKSPFDLATSPHHAHQEIVKGLTIEFAGPYLAAIEVAHWYEAALAYFILASFWATNLWVGSLLASLCFIALIVLDNCTSRLTMKVMLRFMWTIGMGLAMTNLLWLYLA